jgi:hypothetical protein
MATTLGSTLTTTVWVIDRVHGGTANMGTPTQPACATCFTKPNIHVIAITNLPDGRTAFTGNTSNLTARQGQLRPIGFSSHQCCLSTGRATKYSPATRSQLDTTNRGAQRNIL